MLRRLYFLCISALCLSIHAADGTKSNVLLICIDDLKPNIGAFGDPIAKTPNIDRLAARGVLFEKAYCNQAVCSPSRNALLTSLRPSTLGIYDLETNFRLTAPNAVTLGEYFKKNGYNTQSLGKIFHVGHGNADDSQSWSVESFRPKATQYALASNNADPRVTKKGPRGTATESADVSDETYADGLIAKEAIERLKAAAKQPDQPFLIAVGFMKPHLPFISPKKYWDLYDPQQFKLPTTSEAPKGAPEYAPTKWGEIRAYSDIPQQGPIDAKQTRHLIHGYYAATSYTDAQIGRVLSALEELKLSEKTIVVLWGDHGWHLGDHGMWCKHTNYEQAARIPVIVAAPGAAKGQKSRSLIESVDIYPTLAELAGLPQPKHVEGHSFAKTVKDPSVSVDDHVLHVYPRDNRVGRAIRTPRYRMVEWKVPGEAAETADIELYDYDADPEETKNVAAEHPQIVNELRAILAKYPEAKPQYKASAAKAEAAGEKPKQDRVSMFNRRDVDHDGKLTREEFLKNQPDPKEAPARFLRFDVNQDGVLNQAEFVTSGKSATN